MSLFVVQCYGGGKNYFTNLHPFSTSEYYERFQDTVRRIFAIYFMHLIGHVPMLLRIILLHRRAGYFLVSSDAFCFIHMWALGGGGVFVLVPVLPRLVSMYMSIRIEFRL
jgi:hypothetical protein